MTRSVTAGRLSRLRELAALGYTRSRIAKELHTRPEYVDRVAAAHGITIAEPKPACVAKVAPPEACATNGRIDALLYGGYVRDPLRSTPEHDVMVWQPGTERVPFTVPAGWEHATGATFTPIPLASLGESGAPDARKAYPPASGPRNKSPSWGRRKKAGQGGRDDGAGKRWESIGRMLARGFVAGIVRG